jgi:ABC-type ATPase with predicted acetyltransferase domain
VKYIIDKRFNTSVERTPRVLEVAEGFGLGLTDKEFVIYDNFEVEVMPGDVIYVTGQSGSGKSLILNELARQMADEGLRVADLNKLDLPNKPVIECVGETTTQAADLLAKAGISDAYIYLRKPSELSDGQRYRLKLAILMGMPADVWVADEFGAILDRVTAKCVAFNMQKVARALGKTLIVATTHTDLKDELGPSLTITKRFRQKMELDRAVAEIWPPVESVPFTMSTVETAELMRGIKC